MEEYVMFCAISYHMYNSKNVKNIQGGVLLNITHPWVFFTFLKLYQRYQIAKRITHKRRSVCYPGYAPAVSNFGQICKIRRVLYLEIL